MVRALEERDILQPFPIQSATIPDAMAGRDICGEAPTGSGKTLAFGLPLLTGVTQAKPNRPTGLILAPTRELAEQIKQELAPLAKVGGRRMLAVYGGVGYGAQKGSLRRGVDVLVATPGRLEDLLQQRSVDLGDVEVVVVDEADRMADMGFLPAVRRILDRTSKRRQTMLFSATLDGDVHALSRSYQRDPVRHKAGTVEPTTVEARHHFWLVRREDRVQHTAELIEATGRSIVFTRTRHGADRLAKQLKKLAIGAVALHGGRSQGQRRKALGAFSAGRAQALIATDVAARGIHIEEVAAVIHFDPPGDHKDYLHRAGRTARAGATGTVVSLVANNQKQSVRRMQRLLNLSEPIASPQLHLIDNHDDPAEIGNGTDRGASPTPPKNEPRSRAEALAPEAGKSIYVANLPWAVTADDMRAIFGRFGPVHETSLITDRRTGRSRGFGFVQMPQSAARSAIEALHGSDLDGRDLTVRFARPRRNNR